MKKANGYYNKNVLAKFADALKTAVSEVKSGLINRVSISKGNTKMGEIASVSTLPFMTCPSRCAETCGAACYAAKLANLRSNVLKSWARNTAMALYNPSEYWKQIDRAIKSVRFFRFHVSGDIMNATYFAHMVEIARNNPHTEILAFTKQYEIVNNWVSENCEIPENLHILFSGWTNLKPINPYNFPETNIVEHGEKPHDNWKMCGGNCFECAMNNCGCWNAKHGETIAFNKH